MGTPMNLLMDMKQVSMQMRLGSQSHLKRVRARATEPFVKASRCGMSRLPSMGHRVYLNLFHFSRKVGRNLGLLYKREEMVRVWAAGADAERSGGSRLTARFWH